MIVNELISDQIPSVTSTDSAGMALDWMSEFKINQMPIVDQGKYIGIVTEDDILDSADLEIPIGEIRYSGWDSAYIFQGNHVYDAIEVMSNLKLEILPILDEDETYMGGYYSQRSLILYGKAFRDSRAWRHLGFRDSST